MLNENITQNNESIENNSDFIDTVDYEYNTSDIDYISSGFGNTDSTKTRDITTISTSELYEPKSDVESLSVSGGDLYSVYTVSANQTDENDYSPYMETINEHLEKIDKTLSIIAFFIIFVWCSHKIVNAVRSFCGIGLK